MSSTSLGCEFAVFKDEPTVGFLQTSSAGNLGPYSDSEEEKVTTVRKAIFLKYILWKEILYWVLSASSAGFFWLILYWCPYWLAACRYEEVRVDDPSPDFVLLEAVDQIVEILPIKKLQKDSSWQWVVMKSESWMGLLAQNGEKTEKTPLLEQGGTGKIMKIIEWRHIQLWYNSETGGWHEVMFGPSRGDFQRLHEVGWKQAQAVDETLQIRQYTYGKNTIEVEVEPFLRILCLQLLTPFFIFQLYSVGVWFAETYISYSVVLIIMSLTTIIQASFEIQKSQQALSDLAKSEGVALTANFVNGKWKTSEVPSVDLVPGDVVLVTNGMTCPCDFVLLSGQCIANEAMLTGESAPVIKSPLPLEGKDFNPQTNAALKYILLSGSFVMQAKPSSQPPQSTSKDHSVWELYPSETPVLAVVLQTGCETAKGKLIQTIHYPQDSRGFATRQREEAFKFVFFLFILTTLACGWFTYYAINFTDFDRAGIILGDLDLTTIMIPAALPLVLSIGVAFAFDSLKKKRIVTSSNTHIVTSGHVDCVCYDKTGTLTTEGDVFIGVHTVQLLPKPSFNQLTNTINELPEKSLFRYILSGCHSLAYFKEEGKETGELIGEQLEVEMFTASGWTFHEIPLQENATQKKVKEMEVPSYCTTIFFPPEDQKDPTFLAALRIFPFDAELRTMSTIVLALNPLTKKSEGQFILVKGAPESMKARCTKSSLPADFDSFLEGLNMNGCRVLGCAYKELKDKQLSQIQQEPRASLEKDLTFCGFLVMGNQLKPESKSVLNSIKEAGLRQCMVTGDHVLTALAVAKQCDQVFIDQDVTYILDFEQYVHGEERDLQTCEFKLTGMSDKTDVLYAENLDDLLAKIEIGEVAFSMAMTGNAFSALIDMHEQERPGVFQAKSKSRSRASSLAASVISTFTAYTYRKKFTPLELCVSVTSVYARCKPHEKQMLMQVLQKVPGHYVCMVGDGANDSFALKSADIGLSISSMAVRGESSSEGNAHTSAAASIAAPFCTPTNNISPVKELLSEGRNALAQTIIAFRFMIHYGIASVCQILILYMNEMLINNQMWVTGDLFMNLPLGIVLNTTLAPPDLVKGVPETAILGFSFLYSFSGHAAIIICTQIMVVTYLQHQPWYVRYDQPADTALPGADFSMEVTVLFWVQVTQYITSVIALSHDYAGFRGKWYSNMYLVLVVVLLTIFDLFMIIGNKNQAIRDFFGTVELPMRFCLELIGFLVVSCFVHVLFEQTVPFRAVHKQGKLFKYQTKMQAQRKNEQKKGASDKPIADVDPMV